MHKSKFSFSLSKVRFAALQTIQPTAEPPHAFTPISTSFYIRPSAEDNDKEMLDNLRSILRQFKAPVRYAIAYGSGALPQKGYTSNDKPLVDFIFGVSHAHHWHSLNLMQHKQHYSMFGGLGAGAVTLLQECAGGKLYYNPMVTVNGQQIKYGVISIHHLVSDLIEWDTLYAAGRMQKPVIVVRDDATVRQAAQVNLFNTMRLALLMLPEKFSETNLFETIAGISYQGDFRMLVGAERKNKVRDIVAMQKDRFRELYDGVIQDIPSVDYISNNALKQDKSESVHALHIKRLPKRFQEILRGVYSRKHSIYALDNEKLCLALASSPHLVAMIEESLAQIIYTYSITQALKGFASAGIMKGIAYSRNKILKSRK